MSESSRAVQVRADGATTRLRLARAEAGNTLTAGLIEDLHAALDAAEADAACKVVVIEGEDGVFCTGMDFEEMLAEHEASHYGIDRFPKLLRRFATSSRVVVSAVDGKVMAGGLGLVAASDLVYVSERSTFALSEALWGLLPCVVAPYLIRRIGFQAAYELTLTCRTVTAKEAAELRLADAVAADLDSHLQLQTQRLARLDPATVLDLKAYYRRLSTIDEHTEAAALEELRRLLDSPRVRGAIEGYARYGRLPWK